jgi:hypothetical protein
VTDLTQYRALAAAARAETLEGLTAQARLADVVEELCDMLGQPETEWAAKCRVTPSLDIYPRDDEQDAREFIASLPANVQHVWVPVSRTVYRHAGPWVEANDD